MSTTESPLSGLVNLRDLGGQPVSDGVVTRTGVVYRSDAPHDGDREPEVVPEWPPAVVIDLREPAELSGAVHPLAGIAEVRPMALLAGIDPTAEAEDGDHELTAMYRAILRQAGERVAEVFRIALAAEGPVLVHCAAGKDRTGVISALLLSAAGVREDAIVADYVRTDRNMYRVLQRLDVAPELPPGVDEEDVMQLASTPVDAIEAVLACFAEHPDQAAGWLRAHGVTEAELQRWRERFLTEA
ncbi:tyrosine-protein phosphatase [Saccharopolyspora sp. CA-218241]|uniref:tyrosine-protein phosphatase n=1 Tax=Saccharopolyspora sp. CA-218241 TaxID=3240027 RepID=UPI003D986965